MKTLDLPLAMQRDIINSNSDGFLIHGFAPGLMALELHDDCCATFYLYHHGKKIDWYMDNAELADIDPRPPFNLEDWVYSHLDPIDEPPSEWHREPDC